MLGRVDEVGRPCRMTRRRRHRCEICDELFWPDLRVGRGQRACSSEACQRERRKHTQARWRQAHPAEGSGRRLSASLASARSGGRPALPRAPPASMSSAPWEEIRDGVSAEVFLVLVALSRIVFREARDARFAQAPKIAAKFGDSAEASGRDPRVSQEPEIADESGDYRLTRPEDPTDPGSAAA